MCFFWDKLIKHAYNPIKDEHKLIKQTDNPIKERFICNIFSSGENARVVSEFLPEPPPTHYRMYTRMGRTSNIVALHFSFHVKKTDGLIAKIIEKCASTIFFDLTQNRKNKIFIIWYVQTIIFGFIFFR